MIPMEMVSKLAQPTASKIILFVLDGLGSFVPNPATGLTELETARKPHFDELAYKSMAGLINMVGPGITPGSGPGHLALFGYDPIKYDIGRGILSALGIGFPVTERDLAARGNFATLDADGNIIDRRAGRISDELNRELCQILRRIKVPGVETFVETEAGYRFVLVFRGDGLSEELTDTDPQQTGVPPKKADPLIPEAAKSAEIVNEFVAQARAALKDKQPANGILLRGFAKLPKMPVFGEVYKLRASAIAVYPMYKGLARLVGMEVLEGAHIFEDEVAMLQQNWQKYDFFYIHYKAADSAGEDGDFDRKAKAIEEADRHLPKILELKPDVLAITGDHSTPSLLKAHSWHPVPFLLHSKWAIADRLESFTERHFRYGSLGHFPATDVMSLLMAHALKLEKYGA